MSLQEIIVIAIILFCVSYIVVRIVNYFRDTKKGGSPCSTCTSECELRQLKDQKRQECRKKQ